MLSCERSLIPRSAFRAGFLSIFCVCLIPSAKATPYFVSVSEWGAGFICDAGGSSPTIPLCSVSPSGTGSFAVLPSGFTADPTPGGGATVLTYLLPFTVGTFDVQISDDGTADGDWDLLRFLGDELLFYSAQNDLGVGNCATGLPVATGCDGLADVKTEPPTSNVIATIPEAFSSSATYGPDGSGLFSDIPLAEFNFQSDQLIACPLPNCGPMNIAPPASNPFMFITGLPANPGIVNIPAGGRLPGGGPNFNPLDPLGFVPEPSPASLVLAGLAGVVAARRIRRYISVAKTPGSDQ